MFVRGIGFMLFYCSVTHIAIVPIAAILCPTLEDLTYAIPGSSNTEYNTHVTYVCLYGYKYADDVYVSNMTRTCLHDSSWTEQVPDCVRKFPFLSLGCMEFKNKLIDIKSLITLELNYIGNIIHPKANTMPFIMPTMSYIQCPNKICAFLKYIYNS